MEATQRDIETILNKRWRMEHLYKIKDESKQLVNFKFNDVQEVLWQYCESKNHRGVEAIQDKARKQGVSTYWLLYYLDDTLWVPNTTTAILAHIKPDVQKLFKIVRLAYNTCPNAIKLENGATWRKPSASYDNVNELSFAGINSTIYVALENRGDTINNLHISEAAFITKPERIGATIAAVPDNGRSNITIESTANGVGDWFEETFHECEAGVGAYKALFFGWWQKSLNRITPPKNYVPSEDAQEKARIVKKRYGVTLANDQLFWWDKQKGKLKRLMDQEHPTASEDSFMASGSMVFDAEAVQRIVAKTPVEIREIRIGDDDGKSETFRASIFVKPKPGHTYILGGDPSEGVGGDNSVCEVYDELTMEQVAELVSNRLKPPQMAVAVDNLCRHYNNALAVIERNNHGHAVLDRLKDLYWNIFAMVTFDVKLNKKTKKLGWLTGSNTRDLILDDFEDLVADLAVKINSAIMKSEMLTFITDETGKRQAKSGKHDDTIMASAIALKVARMPRTSFGVFRVN